MLPFLEDANLAVLNREGSSENLLFPVTTAAKVERRTFWGFKLQAAPVGHLDTNIEEEL